MKCAKVLEIKLTNFMGVSGTQEYDIEDNVIISGANAKGKTTLPTAYMWLMFNCDMDMNDSPNIRCKDNDKDDVVVEAEVLIDGKVSVIEKRQKRKTKEVEKAVNGKVELVTTVSDTNTYSIDGEKMSLKEFNERLFDGDSKKFLICSNINGFLNKKESEMREFLMGMVPSDSVNENEIINNNESLAPLKEAFEKGYSIAAIESKAKSTITDKKKDLAIKEACIESFKAQIKEKQAVDAAELELEKADLERRIDIASGSDNIVLEIKNSIMQLEMQKNEAIRKHSQSSVAERSIVLGEIAEIDSMIMKHKSSLGMLEINLGPLEKQLESLQKQKDALAKEWMDKKAQTFDESKCICPVCKRELPEDEVNTLKTSFEKNKADQIAQIKSDGFKAKAAVEEVTGKIAATKSHIEEEQIIINDLNKALSDKEEKLKEYPESVNVDEIEECKEIVKKISELKEKLCTCESSVENIQDLKIRLNEVVTIIAGSDTSGLEAKLEECESSMDAVNTEILNAERIQRAIKTFTILKCEAVEKLVNKLFNGVEFKLFAPNKQGEVKTCCVPMVDGMSIMSMEANKAKRIYGRVMIVKGLQDALGINIPVFIDDAESLDTSNLNKVISNLKSQKIVLKVSDDDLKINKIGE